MYDRAESLVYPRGYGFVGLTGWSSLTFTGGDRQVFLHNFCTNDIRRLAPGENCEAFVTNAKGKTIGHGLVTCRQTELVFVAMPGLGAPLFAHFDRYIIREDVQIRDTSAERCYLLLFHDGAIETLPPTLALGKNWLEPVVNTIGHLDVLPVNWMRWDLVDAGVCGLLELSAADVPRACQSLLKCGVERCDPAAFEARRIEAGTPLFGVDFDEQNLPQEVGRDRDAISFTKGCYLGQETVARIDALGHVNQRIVGVRFSGSELPDAGMVLLHDGTRVGRVTSAAFSPCLAAPLALAMVRRQATAVGTRLESPAGACEVVALPVRAAA